MTSPTPASSGVSRRRLLGAVGAGGLAGAAAVGGVALIRTESTVSPTELSYDFFGAHQAGIVTPAQDRLFFAAFDVTTGSRDELVALLQRWTDAAAEMTGGGAVGGEGADNHDSPPTDTGEALGLPPSGLTITFGFGPTLFEKDGVDRFGLKGKLPKALRRLPHFAGDNLDPARSDGDLCVQACANDPQVAVHAIRNLARIGFGTVAMRWSQLGFGRTSSTSTVQETPRNLMGFKDGTANIKAEETSDLDDFVWVASGDDAQAEWLAGGSYLVARRITMFIEPWDRTPLGEQEKIFGRDRPHGAPLTGGTEFTELDLDAENDDGSRVIPFDSHVRLAHPTQNAGTRLLRRGYNFTDGTDSLGRLDAGLFFVAFVRDPRASFIPMQTKLSAQDSLMEYIQHTGSALFAVPPGVKPGQYVGQSLFA